MTPDIDPGHVPPGARPLGGGAYLIPLRPLPQQDPAHPAVRHARARMTVPRRVAPAFPPIPQQVERTLPDEELERGARLVGMVDQRLRYRRRRVWDRPLLAVARALGVAR